jgi:ATP-dependent DNA helicase PIF1
MTGCAALLIGGRTVHSFLGVGLAKGTPEELAASVKKLKGLVAKLCKLELLFIDEISMCSAEFLDKISRYLQIVRRNDAPFGGVQMVFMGDFMQLPPVIKGGGGAAAGAASAVFAFESAEWRRLAPRVIVLTQVMRQANDLEFATMLERLRWGNCLPEDLAALTSCKDRDFGAVRPTILFSINRDVERVNTNSFMALLKNTGNPPIALKTEYGGNKEAAQRWARSCEIPDEVVVAVGAQVVVTANMDIDSGIVNGTRAIVHAWNEGTKICTLRLVNGRLYKVGLWKPTTDMFGEVPKVLWYPIKLAYALSVHKAQGMTLDAAELDLGSSIFEFGQAYTALSRVRSLQDVCILDVSAASFKSHPKVKAFYASAT